VVVEHAGGGQPNSSTAGRQNTGHRGHGNWFRRKSDSMSPSTQSSANWSKQHSEIDATHLQSANDASGTHEAVSDVLGVEAKVTAAESRESYCPHAGRFRHLETFTYEIIQQLQQSIVQSRPINRSNNFVAVVKLNTCYTKFVTVLQCV